MNSQQMISILRLEISSRLINLTSPQKLFKILKSATRSSTKTSFSIPFSNFISFKTFVSGFNRPFHRWLSFIATDHFEYLFRENIWRDRLYRTSVWRRFLPKNDSTMPIHQSFFCNNLYKNKDYGFRHTYAIYIIKY